MFTPLDHSGADHFSRQKDVKPEADNIFGFLLGQGNTGRLATKSLLAQTRSPGVLIPWAGSLSIQSSSKILERQKGNSLCPAGSQVRFCARQRPPLPGA